MWPAESPTAWHSVTRARSSPGAQAAMDSWASPLLKMQWQYQGKSLSGLGFLTAPAWKYCPRAFSLCSLQLVEVLLLLKGLVFGHLPLTSTSLTLFLFPLSTPWVLDKFWRTIVRTALLIFGAWSTEKKVRASSASSMKNMTVFSAGQEVHEGEPQNRNAMWYVGIALYLWDRTHISRMGKRYGQLNWCLSSGILALFVLYLLLISNAAKPAHCNSEQWMLLRNIREVLSFLHWPA